MNDRKATFVIVALVVMCFSAFAFCAPEPDTLAKLDQALKNSATFEYASAPKQSALVTVEQLTYECAKDARLKPEAEARILKALDGQLTRDAKSAICRQLVIVGSKTSIAKLEALVADPELSNMARYVLGQMEYPEATAALQRAMSATTGKVQAGIIYTLANRRCAAAIPEIAKLASSSDAVVAEAAAAALGQLGGAEAVKALEACRGTAVLVLQIQIDQALLAAADGLLIASQKADAIALYQALYAADRSKSIRIGALRGLVQSRGDAAGPLIVEAAKGNDPQIAAIAIGYTRLAKGPAMSKVLADLLPALSPVLQEAAVRALGDRGDATALATISDAAKSKEPAVRLAALEVLGNIGDESYVMALATAATGAGDEQRAARESLTKLKGTGVNDAIVKAIAQADPKVKVELVKSLVGRKSATSAQLFALAQDTEATVRREAIVGLGWNVAEKDLETLVKLTLAPKDKSDWGPLDEAVTSAFRRLGEPAKRTQMVASLLGTAPADSKPVLVRFLRGAAGPEALAALRNLVNDPDKHVQDAAIRTLSEWPDSTSVEDLLNIAKSSTNQTHKVLALRGVVRLADSVDKPMSLLKKAMSIAERVDEKRLVLGAMGREGTAEALTHALECLKDAVLQHEAATTIIQISGKLKNPKDVEKAKAALLTVVDTVKDAKIIKQAENALEKAGVPRRERRK